MNWIGRPNIAPVLGSSFVNWWTTARTNVPSGENKKLNSMVVLVAWTIWYERNSRVFDNKASSIDRILDKIKGDALNWSKAGAKCLRSLFS